MSVVGGDYYIKTLRIYGIACSRRCPYRSGIVGHGGIFRSHGHCHNRTAQILTSGLFHGICLDDVSLAVDSSRRYRDSVAISLIRTSVKAYPEITFCYIKHQIAATPVIRRICVDIRESRILNCRIRRTIHGIGGIPLQRECATLAVTPYILGE